MKFLVVGLFTFLSVLGFAQEGDEEVVYEFNSPFLDGVSDVVYSGQTTRQILINSLKEQMGNLVKVDLDGDGFKVRETKVNKGNYELGEQAAFDLLHSYISYVALPEGDVLEGAFYGFTPLYFQGFKSQMGPVLDVAVVSGEEYDSSTQASEFDKLTLDYLFPESSTNLVSKLAGNDNEKYAGVLYGVTTDLNPEFSVVKHSDEEDAVFSEATYPHSPEGYLNYLTALWAEDAGRGIDFTVQVGVNNKFQTVNKVGVLSNGWDLTQLTQKFLHGAISFSQAARDYMSTDLGESKGLNADNSKPAKSGAPYTALAHHWDEAFGYYGASKYTLYLTDTDVKNGVSIDYDFDNRIDVKSEVNFGLSVNSAKRDLGSLGTENFSESIFNKFVEGRTLIAQKPEGYREEIKVIAKEILAEWERLFAANAIHYINYTINEYKRYNTEDGLSFTQFAKFWGEMKGFALAFQFNPNSVMSVVEFQKLHELLRLEPEVRFGNSDAVDSYIVDLKKARLQMSKAYGFSPEVAEAL